MCATAFFSNYRAFHGGVHAPFLQRQRTIWQGTFSLPIWWVLSRLTAFTLPSTLNLHKERYYKAFSDAEELLNHGEVTTFLHAFLELD